MVRAETRFTRLVLAETHVAWVVRAEIRFAVTLLPDLIDVAAPTTTSHPLKILEPVAVDGVQQVLIPAVGSDTLPIN